MKHSWCINTYLVFGFKDCFVLCFVCVCVRVCMCVCEREREQGHSHNSSKCFSLLQRWSIHDDHLHHLQQVLHVLITDGLWEAECGRGSFLGGILSNKAWEEIQLFTLLLKSDVPFTITQAQGIWVSRGNYPGSYLFYFFASEVVPCAMKDKEQQRQEAVSKESAGKFQLPSCPTYKEMTHC